MQSNIILSSVVKTKKALRKYLPTGAVKFYDRWKYSYFNLTGTYKYNSFYPRKARTNQNH